MNSSSPEHSGVFTFPDGKRLKELKLSLPYMLNTTGGEYVLTAGPEGTASAVADLNTGKYVAFSKSTAVDVVGESFTSEMPTVPFFL